MKLAASLTFFLLVCLACASAQTPSASTAPATLQNASLPAGESSVTGCVHGSTDQYYLIENDGTMRLLMGPNSQLQQLLGHRVVLAGNRDLRRDASASSDGGTPHGLRFFQVEEVLAEQGVCK